LVKCLACGKESKRAGMHHWRYPSSGDEVVVGPLCFACHQAANGLRRASMRPEEAILKLLESMPGEDFWRLAHPVLKEAERRIKMAG
jgi:hypothetical protein